MKPRKPIRRVSVKRAAGLREYAKLKARIMARKPLCFVCGKEPATELHHRNGRRGKLLCYEPFIIAVDADCHRKIHYNPSWAQFNGLLGEAGEWNNQNLCQ
jgi:hypothetical protein